MAAGAQTLTAADTVTATIKGTQTVAISHDKFGGIDVLAPTQPKSSYLNLLVPKTVLTVAAFDPWGNIATDTNGVVDMSFSVGARGGTPGVFPDTMTLVDGTASANITWPTNDSPATSSSSYAAESPPKRFRISRIRSRARSSSMHSGSQRSRRS